MFCSRVKIFYFFMVLVYHFSLVTFNVFVHQSGLMCFMNIMCSLDIGDLLFSSKDFQKKTLACSIKRRGRERDGSAGMM